MRLVFLGNMNNLPFYFAQEFKKRGFDVTFIVDVNKDYLLDRPESWNKELDNNYPGWILERPLGWRMKAFKFAFPLLFFKQRIKFLNKFDVIFLNGHWISLGAFIKKGKTVVDVFAGSDLDVAADFKRIDTFYRHFKKNNRLLSKAIPSFFPKMIFKRLIRFQRMGVVRSDVVNYYPTGINPVSDNLLNEIKAGQAFKRLELRGFDCDKFPYTEPRSGDGKFTILNITRFFYLNDTNANKRNDLMIKGIGSFLKKNGADTSRVEIIFFNKGEDLAEAKQLCDEYGLTPFITWKDEVSVEELKNYFERSDVAFDQLGHHWVGAGLFSMLSGRPLIANGRPDIFESITNENSPICQAMTEAEVEMWLTRLYNNRNLVKEIGQTSRDYVLRHYSVANTIDYFAKCFE